jgi:uncharacterized protein
MDPVRDYLEAIVPLLTVRWVDARLHGRGAERLLRENRRQLSLVDCVSFEFMDGAGLREALAVDPDFAEAGYRTLPARL